MQHEKWICAMVLCPKLLCLEFEWKLLIGVMSVYCISANSFLPWIVPPFNSFRGNYSVYEVKNCRNAESIWKILHFSLSKKNIFCRNYSRTYGIQVYHVIRLNKHTFHQFPTLQISIGWLSVISTVIPLALIGFYL